jgi:hypothetical protein
MIASASPGGRRNMFAAPTQHQELSPFHLDLQQTRPCAVSLTVLIESNSGNADARAPALHIHSRRH